MGFTIQNNDCVMMAYRPLLQISGIALIVYAIVTITISPMVIFAVLGLAVSIILITFSYRLTLLLAKIGAWIGSAWKMDD